ncbi:MAG TPA: sulfatase-like hydrolase/transferase, partial [Planctomycetota bacterium]|nr:sulfatase-like hydrolase/transferase [Planctomycetota bacterium]
RVPRAPGGRARLALATAAVLLTASERLTFAVAELAEYRPVLVAADTFPAYMRLHWRRLGDWLGLSRHHDPNLAGLDDEAVRYPLGPIERPAGSRDWNVLWLVSESLRADALDAEIMPATWAFAQRATRFERHFSSGNGTRMGMFGMFYGLYGNAWFQMLAAIRGPVLMDVLLGAGYDVQAFTSARFTYPEFDRTLFALVPPERLHEGDPGLPGWRNDRAQVGALLASLDGREPGRPFFRFMFFESPHAPYDFPPDAVIRPDYLADLNYVALDLDDPVEPIRNRYLNACHHLDSQLARVFDGLQERGLLDSTIVIVTGDHGEEFLERGHWGHNSAFTDEQTRTPLVIHVPGRPPARVTSMSSHHDLPATLLTLLGVVTPSERYSLGHDLFGPVERTGCVISGWDRMALVDAHFKYVLPYRSGRIAGGEVLDADDRPIGGSTDPPPMNVARVRSTLADMSRFLR